MPDVIADIARYWPLLGQGLLATVALAISVMISSLVLGIVLATVRFYQLPVFSPVCAGYVYCVRSIPVIMLLALIHFGVLPAMGIQNSFFLSAFVGLTLSTTAYVTEILRGGFQAIHPHELDASISLGFNPGQRLVYILVPLVLSRIQPAMVNQFVTLIKDTSLASIIGVIELTRASEIIYERTLDEAPLLLLTALIYFGLCYSLSCWAQSLEAGGAVNRAEPMNLAGTG